MDTSEVAEKLLKDKEFEIYTLHKLEKVGDKYNCTIKEIAPKSKNGFYLYSFKDGITEIDAVEGAVIHVMNTGGMGNVLRKTSVKEETTPKRIRRNKVLANTESFGRDKESNEKSPESSV